MPWWAGPDLEEAGPTYDLGVVGEGFGFARLAVRLPPQLDEHGRGLLQVLVSILGGLEDDGELVRGGSQRYWGSKVTLDGKLNSTSCGLQVSGRVLTCLWTSVGEKSPKASQVGPESSSS